MALPLFSANGTLAFLIACDETPAWGLPLGIAMGVFGSVGINIGQNIQASGLMELPIEQRATPFKSLKWRIGLATFAISAIVNFAALALAPAAVLTPLESIQFISNIAWNSLINHVRVSRKMVVGTALTMVGTVISVIFGSGGGAACYTPEELASYWTNAGWWLYLGATTPIAVGALVVHLRYGRRLAAGESPPYHEIVMPSTYTLYSALFGGAQVIGADGL